jgi:flavodoxin
LVDKNTPVKKALIIYWSAGGNTEKVAYSIRDGLSEAGLNVTTLKTHGDELVDYYEYDLVCLGFPIYSCFIPEVMMKFLRGIYNKYLSENRIILCAPEIPGKHALVFCTYAGGHTGVDEAVPAIKYASQIFAHYGIRVVDEWYVVGDLHGNPVGSTKGKLGDIQGRPTDEELGKIRMDALSIGKRI